MIDDIMAFIIVMALSFCIIISAVSLVFIVLGINKYDIMEWLMNKGD